MSTKEMYNVGTTVYYEGDDTVAGGCGQITDLSTDYRGELQLEVTLEGGRILYDVTPKDFEPRYVAGNNGGAEFHVADTWETEIGDEESVGWSGLIGDDNFYGEENPTLEYMV